MSNDICTSQNRMDWMKIREIRRKKKLERENNECDK